MLTKKYIQRDHLLSSAIACLILFGCGERGGALDIGANDDSYKVTPVTREVVAGLNQQTDEKFQVIIPPAAKAPDYQYIVGVGDLLHVKLVLAASSTTEAGMMSLPTNNNSENTDVVLVGSDGIITLPIIGNVAVADKTVPEIKLIIEQKAAQYFRSVNVVIDIKEYRSRKTTLAGEVNKPGDYPLAYQALHVMEAINNAGGVTNYADLEHAVIRHASGASEPINLFALMNGGNPAANRTLFDRDTLYIPSNAGNKVMVFGEVKKPSTEFIHSGRMNLMEALTGAEGLDPVTASYAHIYVIRGVWDNTPQKNDQMQMASLKQPASATHIYQLDNSTAAGMALAAQFPLQPNDVVYVSPTAISQWSQFINQLVAVNPTSAVAAGIYATR